MTHAAIVPTGPLGEDERALIDRARRGDRKAAHTLYERHAPRIHRLIFRLCGDTEVTRDLTQDTFVRAFEHLEGFRGDAAFGTWLHRIAVSVALNERRREKRQGRWWGTMEEAMPSTEPPPADPDLRMRLEQAVGALPEGQRLVFVMHALEGYTHVEIGRILGISEGTSKGRLFDARARLRRALASYAEEYEA